MESCKQRYCGVISYKKYRKSYALLEKCWFIITTYCFIIE